MLMPTSGVACPAFRAKTHRGRLNNRAVAVQRSRQQDLTGSGASISSGPTFPHTCSSRFLPSICAPCTRPDDQIDGLCERATVVELEVRDP